MTLLPHRALCEGEAGSYMSGTKLTFGKLFLDETVIAVLLFTEETVRAAGCSSRWGVTPCPFLGLSLIQFREATDLQHKRKCPNPGQRRAGMKDAMGVR